MVFLTQQELGGFQTVVTPQGLEDFQTVSAVFLTQQGLGGFKLFMRCS